jgi:hypothetical protein
MPACLRPLALMMGAIVCFGLASPVAHATFVGRNGRISMDELVQRPCGIVSRTRTLQLDGTEGAGAERWAVRATEIRGDVVSRRRTGGLRTQVLPPRQHGHLGHERERREPNPRHHE